MLITDFHENLYLNYTLNQDTIGKKKLKIESRLAIHLITWRQLFKDTMNMSKR